MALLQYKAPVDYAAQQCTLYPVWVFTLICPCSCTDSTPAALESFLEDFKTSPEQAITHAFGNINIDADEMSDEYDFVDEDDEAEQRRIQERARKRLPQYKYKDMLQKLADRKVDELVIDLDDLATVRFLPL